MWPFKKKTPEEIEASRLAMIEEASKTEKGIDDLLHWNDCCFGNSKLLSPAEKKTMKEIRENYRREKYMNRLRNTPISNLSLNELKELGIDVKSAPLKTSNQ